MYTAIRKRRCGERMLFVVEDPWLHGHHASRAIPYIALCFHVLTRCTYCPDVNYAEWNTSVLTSSIHVMQKNISCIGSGGMKTAVVQYAKTLRRSITSTTPLE